MTLNGVHARYLRCLRTSVALVANYVTVGEGRSILSVTQESSSEQYIMYGSILRDN